ncbi:ROK family protein [Streptomyces stackebrandtii]|uniref:ROK family protein n=1 Tax=Streptomyces stackebrandtii TaxID=3051177 RepID=UPI0028DB0B83|nr:ROK family protein [Streptomyces sp. DSM 40976]
MRHVIALDVGRTGMTAALVGLDGTLLYEARRATGRERGPAAVVESILGFAKELRTHGQTRFGTAAEAAGVAVPGLVDAERGVAVRSAGLGWRNVPLRGLLRHKLGRIPVALAQEVHARGLAEGRIGAGRGAGRFLFVSVGTAVAGAIGIEDGIESGAGGRAGEIGHLVVRPGGPVCGCGRRGCLEALASAAAIGRAWAAASGAPAPAADAGDCAQAARAGDAAATGVWRAAVDALADGLLTAHTVLDPRTLIVGGPLAEAGDILFVPLRAAVAERLTFQKPPTIVPAALGDAAGRLGAGLSALDLLAAAVAVRPSDSAQGGPVSASFA